MIFLGFDEKFIFREKGRGLPKGGGLDRGLSKKEVAFLKEVDTPKHAKIVKCVWLEWLL